MRDLRRGVALLPIVLLGAIVGLAGCASTADPDRMSLTGDAQLKAAPAEPDFHTLSIGAVSGGAGTNPMWMANISNEGFGKALEASLRNLDYLAARDAGGVNVVTATIVDLDRPAASLDPVLILAPVDWSVTLKVHYVVAPARGGHAIFDDLVATTGTSSGVGSLTSGIRVRQADEAAVRANIAEFVRRFRERRG